MNDVYLSGFVGENSQGLATIDKICFADSMYDFALKSLGAHEYENDGLGGIDALIENCSISIFTSKEKMSFEEAQEEFLEHMFFDGKFEFDGEYVGYSEFTITGFDLYKCQLGGHDLNKILLSYKGRYINICIKIID